MPELGRDMMRRLVEPTHTRARLFDASGKLVGDTRLLRGAGGTVQVEELPPPGGAGVDRAHRRLRSTTSSIGTRAVAAPLPPLSRACRTRPPPTIPRSSRALAGDVAHRGARRRDERRARAHRRRAGAALQAGAGRGAAVGGQRRDRAGGARRALRDPRGLRPRARRHRAAVDLSRRHIARPVRRLAAAAERVRRGHGRQVAIPDLTARARRDRRSLGRAARDDERAVAAHGRDRALRRRCRARDQEPAHLAQERGRDRGARRGPGEAAQAAGAGARRRGAARPADHRHLRRLAPRCRAVARRGGAGRDRAACSRRWSRCIARPRRRGAPQPRAGAAGDGSAGIDVACSAIEGRLVQVFRNLIANAISFSPPGGTIRIAARSGAATASR